MESSNSFREFETFADNLANLGADIIDIYMIYIYMSASLGADSLAARQGISRKNRFGNCDMGHGLCSSPRRHPLCSCQVAPARAPAPQP
jgi:hypothetical protein